MNTQLREFTNTHTRELVRDSYAAIVILASFFVMLGLFWILDLVISGAAREPTLLLKSTLVMISILGFMGIALAATTVPLVKYRSLGTLKQLSTTPARVSAFLNGHVPVRVALIAMESVIMVVIMSLQGVPLPRTLLAAVTLLLGGLMLLVLGYLVAARLKSVDMALQLSYLTPMLVLGTSGALIPLSLFPQPLEAICRFLPTSWLVDALNAQITGSTPMLPLGVTWLLMTLVTAATAYLALRLTRFADPE